MVDGKKDLALLIDADNSPSRKIERKLLYQNAAKLLKIS